MEITRDPDLAILDGEPVQLRQHAGEKIDPNDIFFLKHAFAKAGHHYLVMDVPDDETTIDYLSGSASYADRSRFPMPVLLLRDLKMPKV